jgi:hypothetical protein
VLRGAGAGAGRHRKLSGAFLSCMRLKATIACRDLFLEHLAALERRHQLVLRAAAAHDHASSDPSPLTAAPV